MSHYYSHVYNNCLIIPRITYPLATSSLTSNHFNKLHTALYPTVIANKGFNRYFQNPLRYGLHKYSGLGLLDLKIEQGIRKIQILHNIIFHPKHQPLIHTIVDWYQISSGLSKPLVQNPKQLYTYVSSLWLKNLLQFMVKNNTTITLTNTLQFSIQRQND